MYKTLFLGILCFILLGGSCLNAEDREGKIEGDKIITVTDYCNFLNSTAATDPYQLFEEKMATEGPSSCIVRRGNPGCYFYEVVDGKEDSSITCASTLSALRYKSWRRTQGSDETPDLATEMLLSQYEKRFSISSDLSLVQINCPWGGAPRRR